MDREKPFPCKVPTCPQSFATEDHLAVHRKTHEMMLNIPGKACFISEPLPPSHSSTCRPNPVSLIAVDKTPTPSRLIKNLEEVGLFEENIFDVTFRKAIEEKHNAPTSLRRMISIQNEDTLHTPQIPLHMYKEQEEGNSAQNVTPVQEENLITAKTLPKAQSSVRKIAATTRTTTQRGRPKKGMASLDKLLPPPNVLPIAGNTPTIPIDFPDEIRIQPKWTVMLQYPAYSEMLPSTTPGTTVKDRLRAYLVKNESSNLQTVTLSPPTSTVSSETANRLNASALLPTLNIISNHSEEREETRPKGRVAKHFKSISLSERQNEAAKRYRNRQKAFWDNLLRKNEVLEQENQKLRLENQELQLRLQEALLRGQERQHVNFE